MRLAARLRRLEATGRMIAGGRPCAECGGPVDWSNRRPDPSEVKIRVVQASEDPGPERCASCGRQLVLRVEWDRGG